MILKKKKKRKNLLLFKNGKIYTNELIKVIECSLENTSVV